MFKTMLTACLILISTSAFAANWKEIAKNEDETSRYYIDTQSITRVGKYTQVNEMADYDISRSASNKTWKSDISKIRYDCANTNSLLIAIKLYAGNKAGGGQIASYKGGDDNRLIASETIAAKIYDYVCHTNIY